MALAKYAPCICIRSVTFQFKGNYSNNYTNFATKFNNCKITFDDSHFLSIAHLSTTYAIVLNDCTSIQCPRKNDCMGCNYIPKNVAQGLNFLSSKRPVIRTKRAIWNLQCFLSTPFINPKCQFKKKIVKKHDAYSS